MKNDIDRRKFLKLIGSGAAVSSLSQLPFTPAAYANQDLANNKILVVLELSGGNDGLNTLVPYGDDAYYRHRPKIGIHEKKLRKIDDHFGFNPDMAGMEKLYKDGKMRL